MHSNMTVDSNLTLDDLNEDTLLAAYKKLKQLYGKADNDNKVCIEGGLCVEPKLINDCRC